MNFVDVQPKSFLDYAWTSPSPVPAINLKPSKTSRKQNRCCDPCRKGKRACDAAILEDTLLDNTGTAGDSPTAFHYSDVFGPLSACGNCDKTKKVCTFEWLRSQRVLQATPQPMAPPAKRRRKSNTSTVPQSNEDATPHMQTVADLQSTALPDITTLNGGGLSPAEFGVSFADFPTGMIAYDMPFLSEALHDDGYLNELMEDDSQALYQGTDLDGQQLGVGYFKDLLEENDASQIDRDSGHGSSLDTLSEGRGGTPQGGSPTSQTICSLSSDRDAKAQESGTRIKRKKRRRSSSRIGSPNPGTLYASPTANTFLSSTNNAYLTDNLLRIYHDSFENALSCWLTERTCPFSKASDVSTLCDTRPNWNRIYHRVFRLDRLAAPIRGRALTIREDRIAARALNLAIFSFATQWSQSSQRSNSKYPFQREGLDDRSQIFAGNAEVSSMYRDFDRTIQISAWHEAHMALKDTAGVESFRVVLAQIVFSLTQPPTEPVEAKEALQDAPQSAESEGVIDCEDLLSKLSLTINGEGPPVHLEQGLRLIHSLRSRVAMSGAMSAKQPNPSTDRLNAGDQATVDLLFWLGIMFDTLSSAMHKRPLVVSDSDTNDIFEKENRPSVTCEGETSANTPRSSLDTSNGVWDDYLFSHQQERISGVQTRWPCSFDEAASLLCDAAPVKVLLFRKVTRIQTLLSRNVRGERIEMAIEAALNLYKHWAKLYAPFIRDCITNHDSLPPRIQSWYICLTGHWHLATLLLADLIEIIDSSDFGIGSKCQQRMGTNFLAIFRERNCQELSDIAQCACPREDSSFAKGGNFHFAVNAGALLTEPWTEVLIRAFAKAGVVLLGSETLDSVYQEDAFRRADACIKALWYLGRKSDMALAAAKILSDLLRGKYLQMSLS